jgi:hypothetical protein
MPLPELVDSALRLAKQPAGATPGVTSGPAAALLAVEALAACAPEERQMNQ